MVEALKGDGGGTGVRGARIPSDIFLRFCVNRRTLSSEMYDRIERIRDTRGVVVWKLGLIGELGLSRATSLRNPHRQVSFEPT
jgi:hypothetical protein